MIQQSLRITRNDIKFELHTQQAQINYSTSSHKSSPNQQTIPGELRVAQNTKATFTADTYPARKVLGYTKIADVIAERAAAGVQNAQDYTGQTAKTGRTLGDVHTGVQMSDIVKQREGASFDFPSIGLLSEPGVDVVWQPHTYELDYQVGSVSNDWTIPESNFEYTPGGVSMEILQMPSVEIEYVGKPLYFPRSYEEKF